MERLIKDKVRCELWRTIKFITHTSQKEEITEKLRGMLNLEAHEGNSPAAQAARENWCRIYESVVMSEINKCRTYVIGRIREAVFEYKDTHKGEFPPLDLWKLCASREIKEDNMTVFVDYMDKLLPRATGNTVHWGKSKRCFETVSTCSFPGTPEAMFVPPSTEGFLLTVLEGYGTVWHKQWLFKQEHGKKAELPCPRAKQGEELSAEDKTWLSKYTNMDNGQKEFGGWLPEGIKKFVDNTIMVRQARQMGRAPTLEARALALMRTRNGVTVQTAAEFNDKKRKNDKNKENEMELIVTYGVEV
jgi:hypothetical protein